MHPEHKASWGKALVLAGLLSGCPDVVPPGPTPPPYDGGPLEREPACTLTGALQVTLGEGDGDDFTPLAPGQKPVFFHGPQGGTHVSLGVRVDNPATEFPGLKLEFLGEFQECESSGSCGAYLEFTRYSTVVRGPEYLLPQEGGAVAVSGLIIQGPWEGPERHRLRVDVLDRCGRTGFAVLELSRSSP
jgi:hypothetical protein